MDISSNDSSIFKHLLVLFSFGLEINFSEELGILISFSLSIGELKSVLFIEYLFSELKSLDGVLFWLGGVYFEVILDVLDFEF